MCELDGFNSPTKAFLREAQIEERLKSIKAFKKYLETYHGDYDDKDIERFKRLLDE